MVGEILHYQHAVRFTLDFHSFAYALKRRERALDCFAFDSPPVRQSNRRQRVEHVVFARDWHADARYFATVKRHAKFRRRVLPQNIARIPVASCCEAERFNGAKSFGNRLPKVGALAPDQYAPPPRHQVHQAAELQSDGGEIGENVRVIVLQRSKNQFVRMIMQEFRPTIEEGGLVLIAFDDKFLSTAKAIASFVEIGQHTADEKIRPPSGYVKNPGKHRSGCSFPVRSRYYDRCMPRNKIFLEKLRHRAVRNFFVENIFHLRVSARDDIPHHRKVRNGTQILLPKSFVPANAQRIQQC